MVLEGGVVGCVRPGGIIKCCPLVLGLGANTSVEFLLAHVDMLIQDKTEEWGFQNKLLALSSRVGIAYFVLWPRFNVDSATAAANKSMRGCQLSSQYSFVLLCL
jgi:hypothetical protein